MLAHFPFGKQTGVRVGRERGEHPLLYLRSTLVLQFSSLDEIIST